MPSDVAVDPATTAQAKAQRLARNRARRCCRLHASRQTAFTLVELMVVVALIAALATAWLGTPSAGGQAAALRSAEATLANVIVATRTRAVAAGRSARLLVHSDPASPLARERYLRQLVIQVHDGVTWSTMGDALLPPGVYLVPRDPASVSGLLRPGAQWTRPSDGEALRSTALRGGGEFPGAELEDTINGPVLERWTAIVFSAIGTTANTGDLVLAGGRATTGNPPVELDGPDLVCGATLSGYGVVTLVPDRASF